MLGDVADVLNAIFGLFLSKPNNQLVIAFVTVVILCLVLFGINRSALSRNAMANTATTFVILAINLILAPLNYHLVVWLTALYARLGIPAISPAFWESVPWLVVALVALLSKDFLEYWAHRFLHMPLAWPIHAVHHSDNHVNGFTTFRVHLLEVTVMLVMNVLFLSWLGIPAELVAAVYIFAALHNAYIHFEVDIDHGPLNWLIASPRFHRWHHADLPEAYGKNLANIMPFWDLMFGTYYHRTDACHEPMGLVNDGIPANDPVRLVLLPFAMWLASAKRFFTARLAGLPRGGQEGHKPGL